MVNRGARTSVLKTSLKNLGVQNLSKQEVEKMKRGDIETKIRNWIQFIPTAVGLLFAERQLCNKIFEGVEWLQDECFSEIISDNLSVLLSLAEAVVNKKRSHKNLPSLLDMYAVMRELEPEIKLMLEGKACERMLESSLTLVKQVAETALDTFVDYAEVVEKDDNNIAVPDGTIHPFTSVVMNFIFHGCKSTILKELFEEFRTNIEESNSQLHIAAEGIMTALQYNLNLKSKQFKDQALRNIFLMNNFQFMVTFVERSDSKDLVSDNWTEMYEELVQQKFEKYQHESWSKVLHNISREGLTSSSVGTSVGDSGKTSRRDIKDRLNSFSHKMKELHLTQRQWLVPDIELRKSLQSALKEALLPLYGNFLKDFGAKINKKKHLKYSVEEVQIMIDEFFEGKPPLE